MQVRQHLSEPTHVVPQFQQPAGERQRGGEAQPTADAALLHRLSAVVCYPLCLHVEPS